MTNEEYFALELAKARPPADDPERRVQIKARGGEGESKWLSLTPALFEAVVTLLTTPPTPTMTPRTRVLTARNERTNTPQLAGEIIARGRSTVDIRWANGVITEERFGDLGVTWVYAPKKED